jgi:hypothetical protein
MNTVDSYFFDNTEVVIQLQDYTEDRLNNNSFLPNVDTANSQSFFSQLDTLVLQPFYTFIYLDNQNGNGTNFLSYFDENLFGDQSSLPYESQLRFYENYLKKPNEATPSVFSPSFFKNTWFADKTSENQYIYLFLQNPESTMAQAYTSYRNANTSEFKTFTGTILESYDTFQQKWSELLKAAYNFSLTQHHPVFDGTHTWNQLPISLRRRWKQGLIERSDPYLLIVNCCVAPLFQSFFETDQSGALWPIYEAHGFSPNTFDARYFRVPGPSISCFYFSLPAIWEQLNGWNELVGKWNATQYFLSRMTHVLRLPTHTIQQIPANLTTNILTSDDIETNIRNVDRTQRFLCSYSQTLNQSETNADGIIEQSKLTELGHIYFNTQTYKSTADQWKETHQIVSDEISRTITNQNSDHRFTYTTRNCDTSIFNTDYDYISTVNATTDSNLTLQQDFIVPDANVTYEIFSTGMIDDPRIIQQQLYNTEEDNYKSIFNALRYAEEYIVNLAETDTQIQTYLVEFYNGAVPSTINITPSSIGSVGSVERQAFYTTIEEYLFYFLKHKVLRSVSFISESLSYSSEIRKLTYAEKNELTNSESANEAMTTGLLTYDPNDPLQRDTIAAINSRHSNHLGITTSDIHPRQGVQTPFVYYQVSPQLSKTEYAYQENPSIQRL